LQEIPREHDHGKLFIWREGCLIVLYIVPTPIGKPGWHPHRAIEVLSTADIILAEDTRTTKRLLDKYNIKTPLKSYHAFNEHQTTANILELLQEGKTLALVSDAGTPGISDLGFLLVRSCREAGEEIVVLPGPTAFPLWGQFPCDRFILKDFFRIKKDGIGGTIPRWHKRLYCMNQPTGWSMPGRNVKNFSRWKKSRASEISDSRTISLRSFRNWWKNSKNIPGK
jgi:hypothetical protein